MDEHCSWHPQSERVRVSRLLIPHTKELSEWSLATFQVPLAIIGGPSEGLEDSDDEVQEATIILDACNWYFYRSVNDTCPAVPGLLATANREKSKLMIIINDVAAKLYTDQME